jgi:hypothetical protein
MAADEAAAAGYQHVHDDTQSFRLGAAAPYRLRP